MKTYNIKNRLSKQAKSELERIIETHETYKKAYFFRPSQKAAGRRNKERKFEEENPDVCFLTNKGTVTVRMSYRETTGNVYYKLHVWLDDQPKNISLIKKILNKKFKTPKNQTYANHKIKSDNIF